MFDYNSSQEIKRTVKIRPSCGSVYIKKVKWNKAAYTYCHFKYM